MSKNKVIGDKNLFASGELHYCNPPKADINLQLFATLIDKFYMICDFCQKKAEYIDYKDTQFLRKFVTSQFKIGSAKRNRLCNKHQRGIANAIKLARFMALMPYTRNQTVAK